MKSALLLSLFPLAAALVSAQEPVAAPAPVPASASASAAAPAVAPPPAESAPKPAADSTVTRPAPAAEAQAAPVTEKRALTPLLPPPPDPRTAFASVDQATMQTLFRTLRESYIRQDDLSWDALNRAALAGMVQHLGPGAVLVDSKAAGSQQPLAQELLTPDIAWLRPGAFTEAELPVLDKALAELDKTTATLLVLDLRCPVPHAPVSGAAGFLSRFTEDGTVLCSVRLPGQEPQELKSASPVKWKKKVVLLVDEESCNCAEIIAAVLKQQSNPLIAGAATRGAAAQFRDMPLTDAVTLRFAEGAVLSGGKTLFGVPVVPDFPLRSDAAAKRQVITDSATGGMARHVFEKERPRLNEAALVAGTNPELPQRVAETEKRPTEFDAPPVIDRVLQQTVDLLQNARFLGLDQPPEVKPAVPATPAEGAPKDAKGAK